MVTGDRHGIPIFTMYQIFRKQSMENNHRYSEKIYTNSKGYNTRPAIVLSTTCWCNELFQLDIARKSASASSTNYSPIKRGVL